MRQFYEQSQKGTTTSTVLGYTAKGKLHNEVRTYGAMIMDKTGV